MPTKRSVSPGPFPLAKLEALIRARGPNRGRGRSLHALARRAGCSSAIFHKWRARAHDLAWSGPTPRVMTKVADALGLRGAEREPFEPWLTPPWRLRAFCPHPNCKRYRWIRRPSPADRARLPRRPDGSV